VLLERLYAYDSGRLWRLQLALKLKLRRAWVDSGSTQMPHAFEQLEQREHQYRSSTGNELEAKLAKQRERNSHDRNC
jgi:hypothetical protein